MTLDKIYCSDCIDFLRCVDDSSVHLAVIDPPYNMSKAEWDTFKSEKDYFTFTFKWIDSLLPKLVPDASLYIFNTPYNSSFILQYLVNKGMVFQNWITWDKRDGFGASKRRYGHGQETVLFFTKSNKHTFNYNDIRLPYESAKRIEHAKRMGILKNGKRWYPNSEGRLCGEVWHISSERHKQKIGGKLQKMPHITPKPRELIERIILASSNKGDTVLDCFVGSGTTAIVSKKLGRHYICSDNNSTYVALARKNIKSLNI